MSLKVESIPIADLHEDPANVRRHDERNLATIKASLARFKQQKPIVIDADNVVRAGNGTLAAARELGWKKIDCVRTTLGGTDAVAYAVVDNRSAELAAWDDAGLATVLRGLQSEDFDLATVGFDDAEVDALLEGLASEAAGPGESDDGDEGDDEDRGGATVETGTGVAYPLAVTLTRAQYQRWKARKAELGVAGDTPAFLKVTGLGE